MPSRGTLKLLHSQCSCTCFAQKQVCGIFELQGSRTHTACEHAWPLAWGRHRLNVYLPHDICCGMCCNLQSLSCSMQACGVADYKVETNTNALASVYKRPIPNNCTVAACGRYPNEVTASFMTSPARLSMAVSAMTELSGERMRMHGPVYGDLLSEFGVAGICFWGIRKAGTDIAVFRHCRCCPGVHAGMFLPLRMDQGQLR